MEDVGSSRERKREGKIKKKRARVIEYDDSIEEDEEVTFNKKLKS